MGGGSAKKISWFQKWFNEDYVELYRHRNTKEAKQQITLIVKTLKLKRLENACAANPHAVKKILDVACGYGRHVALLRAMGFHAEGIDLSRTLVQLGKQKNPQLPIRVQDMRALGAKPICDVLLSLFTSFGFFPTKEENFAMFHKFYNTLHPNGFFWFDYMNVPQVLKNIPSKPYVKKMPSGRIFTETISITRGRVIKAIHLLAPAGENRPLQTKHYREEVWLFHRKEILEQTQKAGFALRHQFGNYDGSPWNATSPRLILALQKPSNTQS